MKSKQLRLLICCLIMVIYTINGQNSKSEAVATYKGAPISLESALSMYIKFNSVSGNEKEAGKWLKEICTENGLFVKQMGEENGNFNLAASLYPLSEQLPNIIFLNHIDVVPAGTLDEWTYNPFSGEIVDGEIWGRGAFDNKGNAIMQLFSILEIKKVNQNKQLPYNITFLAVSCEETQEEGGVKYVVDNYLKELNAAVIIGEGPPGISGILDKSLNTPLFAISIAHKRALWLELELSVQTSGHGSVTPLQYANKEMNTALYSLLKKNQKAIYTDLNVSVLKQLGNLKGGIEGCVLKHPKLFKPIIIPKLRKQPELFSLFSNTITLTSIDSHGEAINVIPSKVTARLDCRLLPSESSEDFLSKLIRKLNNDAIEVKILNTMPAVESSSTESIYYNSMAKAVKYSYPNSELISTLIPNFNDVGIFRQQGIPGYSIIPVQFDEKYLELIHNTNERIPISMLEKGKETYVYFINELLK